IRSRLDRYEGVDPERVEVIYNGIERPPLLEADVRRELRASLGFAKDEFVVGSVGRLDPIKNYGLLVESIAKVRRSRKNVRGMIVGDGPEFDNLCARIKAAGVSEQVVLTGFRNDARQLVQCLDLFVLSSFSEGTSVALLEAIACGIPVLVTSVGGNLEVVSDGSSGWVVPSDSLEPMAGAILDAG
ncbi:MAG: glycosyltransferase, partial [Rhodothermales bacterium]|nr:glycosyltransferase [Rhodothermales bacterium]